MIEEILTDKNRFFKKRTFIISLFFVSIFCFIFSLFLLILSITDFDIMFEYFGLNLEWDLSILEEISYFLMYFSLLVFFTSIFLIVEMLSKNIDSEFLKLMYIFIVFSIPIVIILIRGKII